MGSDDYGEVVGVQMLKYGSNDRYSRCNGAIKKLSIQIYNVLQYTG